MGREHSSGQQFMLGDRIKGYEIVKTFNPGAFTFPGIARASNGQKVFIKKYRRPGGMSPWLQAFMDHQAELKRRVQGDPAATAMCYEFVDFFELSMDGTSVRLRAYYQVFECIEGGGDLRAFLSPAKSPAGSLDWPQRVMFAKMLLSGINAIHRVGIVHSDLKPENLYLLPDAALASKFKLRIIDMDASLLEGRRAPWDGTGEGYVGTPGYMSPEHVSGAVPQKHSDVFTAALILSELLCGRHPAAGYLGNEAQYAEAVKSGRLTPIEVPQPIERVGDLRFLSAVLTGCLRPEASRRPTIEEILRALNGALASWDGQTPRSVSSSPPAPSVPPPVPPPTSPPAPAPPGPSSSGPDVEMTQKFFHILAANRHGEMRRAEICDAVVAKGLPKPYWFFQPAFRVRHGVYRIPTIDECLKKGMGYGCGMNEPEPVEDSAVQLVAKGRQMTVRLPGTFGQRQFKDWGDEFTRFMSPEQFQLLRAADERWLLAPCASASNTTYADGQPLTGTVPIRDGMTVSLGRAGKCRLTLRVEE